MDCFDKSHYDLALKMSSTATQAIRLDSPSDWEAWNREIIGRAEGGGVGGILKGIEKMPVVRNLSNEVMMTFSRTKKGNERIGLAPTGHAREPEEEGGSPRPLLPVHINDLAVYINDLDNDGFTRLQFVYERLEYEIEYENKLAEKKLEEVSDLRIWISSTVCKVYLITCCPAGESIAIWYANLKMSVGYL